MSDNATPTPNKKIIYLMQKNREKINFVKNIQNFIKSLFCNMYTYI